MTPEQEIIRVLVEELVYWAKPGKYAPGSEDYFRAGSRKIL
jgi:hypothetical protein